MENIPSMVLIADNDGEIPQRITNSFQKYTDFKTVKMGSKSKLVSCKDTNLGRRVLLKMLRPEYMGDRIELRRLIREARITSQLQHPATAPLYEIGQTDEGAWYFAMKNIEGSTLFDIIVGLANRDEKIESHFGLNRLLAILTQVGDTLAYSHALGVIHRDVKPENIIVGMFGEVTLIDWGVAKIWGMKGEDNEDTIESRGGTPLYMSPEQVVGGRLIDERTDIYSLGVVMYEMLAQKEPFRGSNVEETFHNILNETPVPPREAAPDRFIPATLETICLKAMARHPDQRYQKMQDMMNEIQDFITASLMRDD